MSFTSEVYEETALEDLKNQRPVPFILAVYPKDVLDLGEDWDISNYYLPDGTMCEGASFLDSPISGIDIQSCCLVGTIFDGCDLSNATFHNCDFTGAHFKECDLSSAEFEDCCLLGALFEECVLISTEFNGGFLGWGTTPEAIQTETDNRMCISNSLVGDLVGLPPSWNSSPFSTGNILVPLVQSSGYLPSDTNRLRALLIGDACDIECFAKRDPPATSPGTIYRLNTLGPSSSKSPYYKPVDKKAFVTCSPGWGT